MGKETISYNILFQVYYFELKIQIHRMTILLCEEMLTFACFDGSRVVLQLLEVWPHVRPGPAGVAQRLPVVVVPRVA